MRSALLCLLLAGCATPGGIDMNHLDAAQLKALVADKNFSALCTNVAGVGGTGKVVYVNVDRTVVTNGAIMVNPDCSITMSNAPNPPKP
jgi:hypothetical protein